MPAAIPAIAAVAGAAISARAARKGAAAQSGAAGAGMEENARQFDTVRELLKPYVELGTGSTTGGDFDAQAYLAANPDVARHPYYGANPEEHYQTYGQAEGRNRPLTPITQVTQGALPAYQNLIGLNGADAARSAISGIESGAEFGSLARQGENAILQNASATGGLRGGNVQRGLADFRSNLLSSLVERQLGRYAGLAEMGQNAAAGVGSSALTTGQRNAALMQQAGAAQAGGMIAGSNAISNAMGTVGGIMAARGAQMPGFAGASGFGSGINPNSGEYIGSLEF